MVTRNSAEQTEMSSIGGQVGPFPCIFTRISNRIGLGEFDVSLPYREVNTTILRHPADQIRMAKEECAERNHLLSSGQD